ncbi:MAG TPA: thermonuclease family protein [Mariprofundaceae bacterium]|nr:thermonuclease family protein [Mariprofundaceae bacterium]
MKARPLSILIAIALIFGSAFTGQIEAGTFSQIGTSRWVTVGKIYDGDTFKTTSGEKVRLLGINTPEVARNDKPGQPLAEQATAELKQRIQGKTVRLAFDSERKDRYARLLAHIYLRDGTWINSKMIELGLAHSYTFAPNFQQSSTLLERERIARSQKLGIWRTSRFKLLSASDVDKRHIGQFRVVSGKPSSIHKNGWGFKLNHLSISIPRAHRKWFKTAPRLKQGSHVIVRGKIRISSSDRLYLALHSPFDLEIID